MSEIDRWRANGAFLDKPDPEAFCYCAIGAGGKPCISREFCDKNKNKRWNEHNERKTRTKQCDPLKRGI